MQELWMNGWNFDRESLNRKVLVLFHNGKNYDMTVAEPTATYQVVDERGLTYTMIAYSELPELPDFEEEK